MSLPRQLKTARMTDATIAKDIDNYVGQLEVSLADIFGYTPDLNITASGITLTHDGAVSAIGVVRNGNGVRIRNTVTNKEYRLALTGSDLTIDENTGTEASPSWANVLTISTTTKVVTFAAIPVAPASNPTTDSQIARKKYVDDVQNATWPVGSVFLSVVATNPGTLLGFGTWASIGVGRTLIGVDPNDSDFNTVEKTGGTKTHTLNANNLPAHTHSITDPGHNHAIGCRYPDDQGLYGLTYSGNNGTPTTTYTGASATGITGTNNNSTANNAVTHMNPYLTVYMWKRTA